MTSAAEIAAELIGAFRAPRTAAIEPAAPVPPLPGLAPPQPVGTGPVTPGSDLLTTLRRRRSLRFFDGRPLPAEELLDAVACGLRTDGELWPAEHQRSPLVVYALCFRVTGLRPAVYALEPGPGRVVMVAELPPAAELSALTLQEEFSRAAAIVSVSADLVAATAAGEHGYRLVMERAGATAYSTWLDAVSRGWVGSVFAGFIPAAVRTPLASDGVSRHQLFALALGHPAAGSLPPELPLPVREQPAGKERTATATSHEGRENQ